jgi:maltose/maltodextrin transport system substrate-binding protein
MGRNLIMVLLLAAVHAASGWTNGQLLIWMRASAMQLVANQFENDFGIPVRIETPEKITQNFPLAVQAGKGPDIAIWAHDKVGEWADGGVIASVEVTAAYKQQFYPIIRFVSRSPKWLNYLRCLPVQSRPCCKQASLKSVVC